MEMNEAYGKHHVHKVLKAEPDRAFNMNKQRISACMNHERSTLNSTMNHERSKLMSCILQHCKSYNGNF